MSQSPNETERLSEERNPADTPRKRPIVLWKIILPVLIGLSVVVYMFCREAQKQDLGEVLQGMDFSVHTLLFIVVAWLFMAGRDFGLTWRFRALTDHDLNWGQSLKVTFLCEFTSCVTPSAVGGSSMGMVFMNSEGIEFGRATTLMLTTLFLDELFFVVAGPLVVVFTPAGELFSTSASSGFTFGLQLTFWLVYAAITLWTLLLFLGIIVKPAYISRALVRLFSLRPLRRWQTSIKSFGDNMIATGRQLRTKPLRFWLESFGATALTWTSRFLVVNALFIAFIPSDMASQWLILARQYVVWVVLMVSPTPGGSGISEWLFTEYYGNLILGAGLTLIIAVCWRILTYYVYLIIGATIIPKWLNDSLRRRKNPEKEIAATQSENTNS